MKKQAQRVSSFVLVLVIFISCLANIISVEAAVITQNSSGSGTVQIGGSPITLDYPPGSYFTDNGRACTDHSTKGIHSATNESACNCKCTYNGTKLGACQCFGYARYIQTVLFGKNSYTNSGSFYKVSGASVSAGSLTASKLKSIIYSSGNVKPGAHLRTNGSQHSMIITQITADGFSIIQANGSNNDEYSGYSACRVGTHTYSWSSYVSSTYGSRGINYIEMPYDYNIPDSTERYVDLGTDFYTFIINTNPHMLIGADANGNVELQNEDARTYQVWYFERFNDLTPVSKF